MLPSDLLSGRPLPGHEIPDRHHHEGLYLTRIQVGGYKSRPIVSTRKHGTPRNPDPGRRPRGAGLRLLAVPPPLLFWLDSSRKDAAFSQNRRSGGAGRPKDAFVAGERSAGCP
jgi:hypothetical protein